MRAEHHTPDPDDTTTLPVLLHRVGAELDRLTLSVDELQVMLSPLLVEAIADRHDLVADIQRLDLLAQTLASLSTFVLGLGNATGAITIDPTHLAASLPLHDLADRLCGRPAYDEAEDFEMF